ncbi:sterol desaturase family protein [Segetibacter sp. 3557_3]|uniref:sterol desaturase family protein n=1 Tax=Segetibacter sp. 3557_3 TaxID=2547429 RepID=UPI0010585AB7|nr:sterol desaturase family protein [Segetibacter sp. 3557_3]TDH21606.1 sterol desaturase family protein [Segetibacter sp. 3557_3]
MKLIHRIFDRKGTPVLTVVFVTLFLLEGNRALRKRKLSRASRVVVNALVSVPAFTLLRFILLPVLVQLARKSAGTGIGLNHRYQAPRSVKGLIAFLLLDYTNYLWHILNHKLPILWRFHLVHHTDPDLDVSTALRFHFGELIGSVFYRGFCVFAIGASPFTVLLYEILFETATQFHHSNLRLTYQLEKRLNKVIVTPRMHGIHHSVEKHQADSNYSVIFSFWDRLHKTALLNVPQQSIVTGSANYLDHTELTVQFLLRLPFSKIRTGDTESSFQPSQWEQRRNMLAE